MASPSAAERGRKKPVVKDVAANLLADLWKVSHVNDMHLAAVSISVAEMKGNFMGDVLEMFAHRPRRTEYSSGKTISEAAGQNSAPRSPQDLPSGKQNSSIRSDLRFPKNLQGPPPDAAVRRDFHDHEDKMTRYIDLTAHIVRAYTANNTLPAAALPDLIAQVHGALLRTADASGSEPPAPAPARAKPRKTVFPGYIVSLEDGKRYKSLRRHLGKFGLTPEEYRAKWNLPPTYPMVCEEYSKERSTLALKMGLGRDKGSKVITLRGKRALARPAKSETPATGKKAPTRK